MLIIYKVLSFLLIPFALLFGLMAIVIFFMAISSNPAFLLVAFALTCYVIYTITSFIFLFKGVVGNRSCKPSLKDWIKVNAYGTSFICFLFVLQAMQSFFMSDIALRSQLTEMLDTQPQLAAQISIDTLLKMFRGVAGFLFVVGTISITHVVITFRLFKKYTTIFNSPSNL